MESLYVVELLSHESVELLTHALSSAEVLLHKKRSEKLEMERKTEIVGKRDTDTPPPPSPLPIFMSSQSADQF